MSDHTNLDLQTAQSLLIAAGKPELADALKYQSEGIYNLVQGAWGQSFVNSFELMVGKQTQAIADAVATAVRLEVAAALAPFRAQIAAIDTRERRQNTAKNKQFVRLEAKIDDIALRSLAHEIEPDERRALTADLRAVAEILPDLQALVAERRARGDE